ncbi:hypothetical protein WN943_017118 [Citrus x changshan-huyou]
MACFIVRAIDSNGSSCYDCVQGQLVDLYRSMPDNQRILTQNSQSLTRRKSFLRLLNLVRTTFSLVMEEEHIKCMQLQPPKKPQLKKPPQNCPRARQIPPPLHQPRSPMSL